MTKQMQPLGKQFPIINPDGTPTEYFIRWAQGRQEGIADTVDLQEVVEAIQQWSASRDINAGTGLTGGGNLSNDVTINHEDSPVVPGTYGSSTKVPKFTVDGQGHVTEVIEVDISGGGGGGGKPWYWKPPALSSFPDLRKGASAPDTTSSVDADVGTVFTCGVPGTTNNHQTGLFTSVPTTGDWSVTTHFMPSKGGYPGAASLILYTTTGNRTVHFGPQGANNPTAWWYGTLTAYTNVVGTAMTILDGMSYWVKIEFTSSDNRYILYTSSDGKNFYRIGSMQVGDSATPTPVTHVGFGFQQTSASVLGRLSITCDHWTQSW